MTSDSKSRNAATNQATSNIGGSGSSDEPTFEFSENVKSLLAQLIERSTRILAKADERELDPGLFVLNDLLRVSVATGDLHTARDLVRYTPIMASIEIEARLLEEVGTGTLVEYVAYNAGCLRLRNMIIDEVTTFYNS